MNSHDGLSAREHNEMRDRVLAGTQRIRPARSRVANFVAIGVSLVLVGAVAGGILTTTLRDDGTPAPPVTNGPAPTPVATPAGWVAYSSGFTQGDIFFVQAGSAPHRVIGSGDDGLDQVCPAFSADGARLASGQAAGSFEAGWTDAALVVTDIDAAGEATATQTIPLPGLLRPPCPIWSPDGRWIAFGAETEDAARAAVTPEVWLVDTESEEIIELTGLAATDVEWAADGASLYVADGPGILVYSIADGQTRTLDDTEGATALTASPDGQTLAVERRRINAADRFDLVLMDTDGTDQRSLVDDYTRLHGIGPVWSPDGTRIVFQRACETFTTASGQERICREQSDVVVVTVTDDDPAGTQSVLPVVQTTEGGEPRTWFPYNVSWSPDSTTLLYRAWEEIDVASGGTAAGAGLLTVPADGSAAPTILWETGEGIGAYTAFPQNDFQSWGAR